ncbi:hypothetical protein SAMN05216405_4614 [Lachnospiraceae bacterium NLAE-zl-G231]|nr:hypothetical protein SAMN05216405_4614 [Lachnospiraceae bacterium NLAE-zl-G231]
MRVCFVICWFGKLPDYLSIWLKTCKFNKRFYFLLITDERINITLPNNVRYIVFTKEKFLMRIGERIIKNPSLDEPYRVCDFRPMYGIIFKEELVGYDFWGYCDIDLIFGDISTFISKRDFNEKDAIFNGGHFTLLKNNEQMNNLYKCKGSLFRYKTVAKRDAIYAFDETTGIQNIARVNNVNARFGIPYIDTESKYTQLRSRMECSNPNNQAFFWEKGHLYRVKEENKTCYYQEIAYMHLQKRKLTILDERVMSSESFWVMPKGFKTKDYFGWPNKEDILKYNPDLGEKVRIKEEWDYKKAKFISILKRNPFQIYVRFRQELVGINAGDGVRKEMEWTKY